MSRSRLRGGRAIIMSDPRSAGRTMKPAILCGFILVGFAPGISARAQTIWSVSTDWSNAANPNGPWSYLVDGVTGVSGTRGSDNFGTPGAPLIWSTGSNFVGWSQANG